MLKITCLLLALHIVASSQFCSPMPQQQYMQSEIQQYASASQQLSSIFNQEKNLLEDLLCYILNKPQYLTGVLRRLRSSVKVYNNWLIASILCVWIIFLVFLILEKVAKRHRQNKDRYLPILIKTAKIIAAAICLFIFLQTFTGISGGMKEKQSLNTILCTLFNEPKGMLRSSQQSQNYLEFEKYADEIDQHTLYNLKQYRRINNKLLSAKQVVKVSNMVLQELRKEQNSSAYLANFEQSFKDLEQTIKPSLSALLSQIYQIKLYSINYARIFRAVIKAMQNYISRKGLHKLVSVYSFSVAGFYVLVMLASVTLIILLFLKRNQNEVLHSQLLPFIQYLLIMFLIICALSCLLTSILVPSLLWLRQTQQHVLSNRTNFYEQMQQLGKTSPDIVDLAALISPLNMTFSQIFDRRFQKQSSQVIKAMQPYLAFNSTYFYDQLEQALKFIKDAQTREKLALLVQQKAVKQPFVIYFKDYVTARTRVVETFRKQQSVNVGALGRHLAEVFEVFIVLMFNRSYDSHKINSRLIICLTVLILLLFLSRKIRKNNINEHKKVETDEQIDLSSDKW